jgi:16S rRNA G527 N7-methylase RsmG
MEMLLTRTPGSFHAPEALPCWRLYQHVSADAVAGRAVAKKHPMLGLTEHHLDEGRRVVVVVNYSPHDLEERLELRGDWRIEAAHHGQVEADGRCLVAAADGAVFTVGRR